MPWVKKKGLYLPDSSSYAQSVSEFQDDLSTGKLYVYATYRFGVRNDTTTTYGLRVVQKSDGNSWFLQETFYGNGDLRWAYSLRPLYRLGNLAHYNAVLYHPQGSAVHVEFLAESNGTDQWVCQIFTRGNGRVEVWAGYGPLSDPLGYLKVGPGIASGEFPLYVMALVIHNDFPPWFRNTLQDVQNNSWMVVEDDFFEGQPWGVDLHWAIQEGLIDPTQFLHFYTFEELDENGYIPDYGSNPQPLALYGNAQLAEAYEVEPQFSPVTIKYYTTSTVIREPREVKRVVVLPKVMTPPKGVPRRTYRKGGDEGDVGSAVL